MFHIQVHGQLSINTSFCCPSPSLAITQFYTIIIEHKHKQPKFVLLFY